MRIVLYNPPTGYYTGNTGATLPSIAAAILASVLNQAGHDASVIDLDYYNADPRTTRLELGGIDVIGITGLTIAERGIHDVMLAIHEAGFEGRVIVGGIHATLNPQQMLDWGADLVVTGECEGNIVSLLETGATGIQKGKPAAIEDIPLPAWDKYAPSITSYKGNYSFLRPTTGITMWSRGCPYRCNYCSNLIFQGQPTRYRPPANIAEEMADLKSRGIHNVYVYDDEMIGCKQPDGWMSEISDRIAPLGMNWICQGRCSERYITHELMDDMKRAGCSTILWGVESFSEHSLNHMRKMMRPRDIWHSLRTAKAAGIKNLLFTMLGNYKETEDDLCITAEALGMAYREGLVDYLQTFVTAIMPGTELERLSKEEGWYTPAEDGNLHMKHVYHGTPWLLAKTIKTYQELYKRNCPVVI